jgi:NAD(P)-dependent dehydrogenase (short-subunit alcohol dehydrogenase family)
VRPSIKGIAGLAMKPVQVAAGLANRPVGTGGRHGPLSPLGVVDRLLRPGNLEDALRDKIVMVTGASSGIGEVVANRIGAAHGEVILVARTLDKLEDAADMVRAAGGTAHVQSCDLSDVEAIDAMADEVLERFGHVDVLINNAGRSIRRSIELSYERPHDFERTMQLNYFAPVRLILKLLPGMRERGWGHVVNISSVGVQMRTPRFSGYIASKAALDTFSDAVHAEALDDGVRFTTIHMPLVRTPMISPTKIYDRFPTLTPDQAGDLVAKALISRPRRVASPVGYLAEIATALSPEATDLVRNRGYHMFPDSSAARNGSDGKGKVDGKVESAIEPPTRSDELSRSGQAFARATRGVHW